MRVGLCFYGGLNEKVLTKELTEHIPGLQLFIGQIKPTGEITDSADSVS